jgi:hypothetical protein
VWLGFDCGQKDLGEYFYRDKVGFVTERLTDSVTRKRVVPFGQGEGGSTFDAQGEAARADVNPPVVRIHGE